MAALQIYDRRERALVTAGDAVLTALRTAAAPFRRRRRPADPARILLLRLERIGDLLMTLPALADVRAAAPHAEIDLVVGSWNAELAQGIASVSRVITVDPVWLAREASGLSLPELLRQARGWRARRYDLALNFEPDIRSNLMLAAAGARWTAGYASGGGGALLDQALDFNPAEHTADNARRLVATVFERNPGATPNALLQIPDASTREAERLLEGRARPIVAMHVAGGRPVKQWNIDRFASVARALVERRGATILLTGGPGDAALVAHVRAQLPAAQVIDASTITNLLTTAALLERSDVVVTGDTGPMHLAHAVQAPIVAVFGPSDPRRYAPRGPRDRIVRVDLPCAPCNRIRLPPARCTGVTPDCLALVTADRVLDTVERVLDRCDDRPAARPA